MAFGSTETHLNRAAPTPEPWYTDDVLALRPHVQAIFDAIMAAYPDGLTLNMLSEELVGRPVDYGEIEELIGALETAGVDLEGPEPPPRPEELHQVLAAARALSSETGQRPTADEIASRTGMTAVVVRRVLRFGKSAAP